MKKYFYLDESPYLPGYHILYPDCFEMPFPHGTNGSYGLLASRILGLDYADYLRFARDVLGAKIIGKNDRYPTVYFKKSDEVSQFVKLLNKRVEYIMYLREHPYEFRDLPDGLKKEPINVSND